MKALIAKGHLIRQNMLAIIGFCLFCYFSYHAVLGERGYLRLMGLERQAERAEAVYNEVHYQRLAIESKVKRLRPGSLDRDLLEERVQYVLGYYPDQARIIIN